VKYCKRFYQEIVILQQQTQTPKETE